MAFMAPPASATNEDRMPFLGFNAKAGRLFLHDRMQQADGEWTTVKTDVTMIQPAFAVDFGRLETGWIHFSSMGPQFSMVFYGQQVPACPDSPGNSATGKPLRFKAGFRVPVIGQGIGGARDFRGNAGALINGMNELHTLFEESAEARAGKIPLVKMTNVLEVQAGQSSNFQPVFTVIRYVDRPSDILGPRLVAPPGAPLPTLRHAASRPITQAPPPDRAAPNRIASAPIRYSAPVDRWDDELRDERPARVPVMATAGGWDSGIPF
jgi:hypothetical protein